MGAVALVLLLSAEITLSLALGRALADYLASFGTPEGALGLARQIVFGSFPLLRT